MNELLGLQRLWVRKVFVARVHSVTSIICVRGICAAISVRSECIASPALLGVASDEPSVVHYLTEIATLRVVDVRALQLAYMLPGVGIEILAIKVAETFAAPCPHPDHDSLSM